MSREIWFERTLWWNYRPCHWKGVVVLVGMIALTGISIFSLPSFLEWIRHPEWQEGGSIVLFLFFFVPLMRICHLHS